MVNGQRIDSRCRMSRWLTLVLAMSLLVAFGCGETQPEPEVDTARGPQMPVPPPPSAQPEREISTAPEGSITSPDEVPRVTIAELQDLIAQDAVQIVDVRAPRYFMEGHIPGSINIPVMEVRSRLEELSGDEMIVTYCT